MELLISISLPPPPALAQCDLPASPALRKGTLEFQLLSPRAPTWSHFSPFLSPFTLEFQFYSLGTSLLC